MKKLLVLLVAGLTLAFLFTSCEKEESFDEALLIGKWKSGPEYFRYDIDYTGVEWNTDEDYTEEDGLPFTWTLEKAELTLIHYVNNTPSIPKVYKITELTATTLKYRDSFSVTHSFTKTN
jgi:hypothetical protein